MIENERPETILTPAQEKALLCLLQAGSIREASKQAEISEAQIYRYLKEKHFIEAYRQARRESLEVAIRKLEGLTGEAIETLREVMNNTENTASQRLYASKVILEFAFKIQDNDLLERIEKLEERVK
jgi:molybdenum-dependent DNA-binding transcriptional regulator ModE